jgi:sec-independent protein translocase protein TatB
MFYLIYGVYLVKDNFMFDLGMQELILIFIVALLVFGPKRLPELGRTLGKGMRELKAALRGVQDSIEEETNVFSEFKDAETSLKKEILSTINEPLYNEQKDKPADPTTSEKDDNEEEQKGKE